MGNKRNIVLLLSHIKKLINPSNSGVEHDYEQMKRVINNNEEAYETIVDPRTLFVLSLNQFNTVYV